MKIGTKSVLLGAHCFFIHPIFVAWGWIKLYGWPSHWLVWVSFFVHDLGYIGKPNMDGPEGELHVWSGAVFLGSIAKHNDEEWTHFSLYHSRYFAKQVGVQPSRLCAADKLAIALIPWWLYLPMVRLTGEIREYKAVSKHQEEFGAWNEDTWESDRRWFRSLQEGMERWAYENAGQCTREPTK